MSQKRVGRFFVAWRLAATWPCPPPLPFHGVWCVLTRTAHSGGPHDPLVPPPSLFRPVPPRSPCEPQEPRRWLWLPPSLPPPRLLPVAPPVHRTDTSPPPRPRLPPVLSVSPLPEAPRRHGTDGDPTLLHLYPSARAGQRTTS